MKTYEDFELLSHYDATAEDKANWAEIMAAGADAMTKYLDKIRKKLKCKYSRTKFRTLVFNTPSNEPCIVEGFTVTEQDRSAMLKVKEIEKIVIESYARMIFTEARRWSRRNHQTQLGFHDFYNEAWMAASNAVYAFTGVRRNGAKVAFTTFVFTVIRNRMMNVIGENKPLGAWSQNNKKLYGKYVSASKVLTATLGREPSFDEIIAKMQRSRKLKLTKKKISALRGTLVHVYKRSELESKDNLINEQVDFGKIPAHNLIENESTDASMDASNLLGKVQMNDWERKVLQAYLTGSRGWASKVARENINPDTRKPYSRRAPKLTLDRVLDRIKKVA